MSYEQYKKQELEKDQCLALLLLNHDLHLDRDQPTNLGSLEYSLAF
jgi:hypothetical protein